MAFRALIIFCLCLPQIIRKEPSAEQMIVWNVGQGLWLTRVSEHLCTHYDMGGEIAPFQQLRKLCQGKVNRLYLSHWDLDHYRFINRFQRIVSSLCLASGPKKPKRLFVQTSLPDCAQKGGAIWRTEKGKTQNDKSVIHFDRTFQTLLPGDSSKAQEKLWARQAPRSTQILVLGHHGSKTATSIHLLKQLPNLKIAIASARQEKYGHPHADTKNRLKAFHIPILSTEDWGNLIFMGK